MTNKKRIAAMALVFVALAWGTSYAIIKDSLERIQPFSLMTIRFMGSALLLSLLYAPKLKGLTLETIKRGGLIGLFMFGAFLALIIGIQYTTASKQSFIIGAYVLFVPFLSYILNGTSLDRYSIIGALLAIVGLGMLTLDSVDGLNFGDVVTIFCSICFALHMIYIERYCHREDPIVLTILQFWTTGILFFSLTAFKEGLAFTGALASAKTLAYLVVVATVLAFATQNVAQKYISSIGTSLILTLEAVFGSLFAVWYLHESMSATMALGCVLVFIGIITQQTKWKFLPRTKKKTEEWARGE